MFRPSAPRMDKIKKSGERPESLALEPTADVLAGLAARRREGQTIVGFAAEHGEGAVERARGKLERKGIDAVVVNDISRSDIGFDVDANEVAIVSREGEQRVPRAAKEEVARAILDAVEAVRVKKVGASS